MSEKELAAKVFPRIASSQQQILMDWFMRLLNEQVASFSAIQAEKLLQPGTLKELARDLRKSISSFLSEEFVAMVVLDPQKPVAQLIQDLHTHRKFWKQEIASGFEPSLPANCPTESLVCVGSLPSHIETIPKAIEYLSGLDLTFADPRLLLTLLDTYRGSYMPMREQSRHRYVSEPMITMWQSPSGASWYLYVWWGFDYSMSGIRAEPLLKDQTIGDKVRFAAVPM